MTKEKAITIIESHKAHWQRLLREKICDEIEGRETIEGFDMAISALSAEPCRTADDYENEIADLHNRLDIAEYDKERYKEEITTLEAENKGEWIESKERSKHWYCSACGGIHTDPETGKWRETFDYRYPFCPNCGARMKGGEE